MMDGSFRCGSSVRWKGRVDEVVLTQGIALPVLGEQNPPEVGMTLEPNAEHVVALALHPVGAAVESGQRGAARLARAEARAHCHDEAGVEVLDAADDLEPLLFPVDRRQPIEITTSEALQREEPELRPEFAGYGDGHALAVDRRLDAKRLPDSRARVGSRHAHLGSEVVGILPAADASARIRDRKSTRLNSSHGYISYAVFCLKKKK